MCFKDKRPERPTCSFTDASQRLCSLVQDSPATSTGRGRRQDAADWQADPGDKAALVSFFHGIRSRIGQGIPDKTALNEAAAFMAQHRPPRKGGPKTAESIRTQFAHQQNYKLLRHGL